MTNQIFKMTACAAIALIMPKAYGAGSVAVYTDSSSNFIDTGGLGPASWVGDGVVVANLAPTGTSDIITGTTGGTLNVGNFFMNAGDPKTYINGDATNTGIALDITVTVTGTNASFNIGGRSTATNGWRNFQVTNMTNVETLTVTYAFSDHIAAMRGDGSPAPYLVSMRQAVEVNTYSATGTIDNLTVDGVAYDDSVLSGAGSGFEELGVALWDDTTGIGTITAESADSFNGLRFLDIDGGGVVNPQTDPSIINDGNIDEVERTYATGMTWAITNDGVGAFTNGSEFYFSFNGVQYEDSYTTFFVPEPSTTAMLFMGLSCLLGYRKRK